MTNILFTEERLEDWRAVPGDVKLKTNVLFINMSAHQAEAIEDYCRDLDINYVLSSTSYEYILTYDLTGVIEPDEFFSELIRYLEEN